MPDLQISTLQNEWVTLQTQFDSYEKYSLVIKLFSVLVCCILIFALDVGLESLFILAILWLQDGIWKTFQHRIGLRLEVVEQAIKDLPLAIQENSTSIGMQFNLAWGQSRPNTVGLVGEYIKQSLKPTVAYPHAALIALVLVTFYVG